MIFYNKIVLKIKLLKINISTQTFVLEKKFYREDSKIYKNSEK